MATQQETITQLKVKLKDAWVRGKEQRIEIGTLLLELRAQAEHGEWGKLLAELGIPATTAADYMVEASRQIHGIRVIGKVADPDAEAIEKAINAAMAQVEQVAGGSGPEPLAPVPIRKPKEQQVELEDHIKVKGPVLYCNAEQKAAYKRARKSDKDRVYAIFHAALMQVIGEKEVCDETLAA
jgi:hypothetical protein